MWTCNWKSAARSAQRRLKGTTEQRDTTLSRKELQGRFATRTVGLWNWNGTEVVGKSHQDSPLLLPLVSLHLGSEQRYLGWW